MVDILAINITLKSGTTIRVLCREFTLDKLTRQISWVNINTEEYEYIRKNHPKYNDYGVILVRAVYDDISSIVTQDQFKIPKQ